ncbi:hypothetical protein QY077_05675 [Klebsiella oxytoca]|uniref:hypothetical protein n=1 Tax=Klebsiella oxytoca TaxID=571 RepID=UPI002673BEB2|nr:hypothetical protein [Klebsiella oxytoca]WKV99816.1 hypothetical protein Q3F89_16870 [Klebsiella oxytoca]WMH91662.1 hypothetical protein QY077_05675 [Klebsiella oxytoca]
MNNLKIEYIDGQLVTVDVEGLSMLNTGLTGLSFEHYLGKLPRLKVEVGGGTPVVTQPQPLAETPVKEGELMVAVPNAPRARPPRNKNRNRNRSNNHVQS